MHPPFHLNKLIAVVSIVVLVSASGQAQRVAALPPAHGPHTIPIVPLELLERAVTMRAGIGNAHDDTSTKSKEAQAFYDQGLAYLHSFVWIEAARSFNHALRLDPSLALAHVGLSYAYLELVKPAEARAALDRARAMAPQSSDHERRHIEIRALQFEAETSPPAAAKISAYRQALDGAIAAFPSDVELVLQRGVAESPDPADRGQGGVTGSVKFYQRALTLSPNHFAAHHYLTHALENTGRIDEALPHGKAYASQASAIPHARHMYGHNLRRAGRVGEALAEFEAADRLHREYFKREQIPAEYDWHLHHNLDLLAQSHQYLGQIKKAEALFQQSFALPSNLVVQVYNKREWPAFLRARGRQDEALTAAQRLKTHPHPLIQAIGSHRGGVHPGRRRALGRGRRRVERGAEDPQSAARGRAAGRHRAAGTAGRDFPAHRRARERPARPARGCR